jgi:HSP20 family molecular chaperone IbpA
MPLDHAVPPVNVYEGQGQISIVMPIPGAHPEHVRLTLTATALRMRADCKYAQERQSYHRRDWQVGSWHADVPLPAAVDPASGRATLNLGVLVVMATLSDSGSGECRVALE